MLEVEVVPPGVSSEPCIAIHGSAGGVRRGRHMPGVTSQHSAFFCESSLLRINQRRHSLRTRLWHTPPAAVKKPTEEDVRERGLGVGVGFFLFVFCFCQK